MSGTITRRAFRNDRMRTLFDRAVENKWTHKLDGSNHVRMTSPDGGTVMVLSITATTKGRAIPNSEAVYNRWVRMQNAITRVTDPIVNDLFPRPAPRLQEETPMGQDLHALSEAEADRAEAHDALLDEAEASVALDHDSEVQTVTPEQPRFLCADGCGKEVKKAGGYALGHHPNSGGRRPKGSKATPARTPANGEGTPDTFTIEDIITIANFAGDGGLVEVSKLKKGLELIASMRGDS